ncbi:MAG: DNA-directed RNA polymerase subunit delta [Bacilli bacterium]
MKLKDITKEELELFSYTDLTNMLLKEHRKAMNTPTIFKEICSLLGYSDEEYMDKIGDYYTSLTIDKRFVLLDNHEWDLREKHAVELVIDDDDDEEVLEEDDDDEEEETEEVLEETEEESLETDDLIDEDLEEVDDDLDNLSIVDDEENL